jgi:hypothetical protein
VRIRHVIAQFCPAYRAARAVETASTRSVGYALPIIQFGGKSPKFGNVVQVGLYAEAFDRIGLFRNRIDLLKDDIKLSSTLSIFIPPPFKHIG